MSASIIIFNDHGGQMQLHSIRPSDWMKYDGHFDIDHQIAVDDRLKSNTQNHLQFTSVIVIVDVDSFNYTLLFRMKIVESKWNAHS